MSTKSFSLTVPARYGDGVRLWYEGGVIAGPRRWTGDGEEGGWSPNVAAGL